MSEILYERERERQTDRQTGGVWMRRGRMEVRKGSDGVG